MRIAQDMRRYYRFLPDKTGTIHPICQLIPISLGLDAHWLQHVRDVWGDAIYNNMLERAR